MKGAIGVISQPGEGACFWFVVPLPQGDAICAAPTSPPSVPAGSASVIGALDVLVADDTPSSLMLVTTLLRQRGHRVTAVDDGAKAVVEAGKRRFHLIILDLQMPILGGLAAATQIRAMPETVGGRWIVALTAAAFEAERESAIDAGMQEVLTKPFAASDFDRILVRAASG